MICTVITMLAASFGGPLAGQEYPKWFLFPDLLPCKTAVGFEEFSSTAQGVGRRATREAVEAYARLHRSTITGTRFLWMSDGGSIPMENSVRIIADEDFALQLKGRAVVLDTFITKEFTALLLSDGACKIGEELKEKISLHTLSMPVWVDTNLSEDEEFLSATGVSEKIQPPHRGWVIAERNAILALAFSVSSTTRSLTELERQYHQKVRESIHITLRDIRVDGRWYDVKNKTFVVRVKMKKSLSQKGESE